MSHVTYNEPSSAEQEAQHAAPPTTFRVNPGTIRHTAGSGLEESGHATYTATQDGTRGGGVMATLRSYGPSPSVELEPGNPSSRTSVAAALNAGVIRRAAGGGYEDVGGSTERVAKGPEGVAAATELPGADPGVEFDAEDYALFQKVIAPLDQPVYDSTLASATLAAVRGTDLASAAKSMADMTGMHPTQALEYVEAGAAMYERTVAAAVAPLGIEGNDRKEAFYAHCREQPAKLQDAIQRLTHGRDPSGFTALAREFKRSNPGDLSTYKAAGFETSITTEGDVLLRRPGGDWVNLEAMKK